MGIARYFLTFTILLCMLITILPLNEGGEDARFIRASSQQNPFNIYHSDPPYTNDFIVDTNTKTLYLASPKGLYIKHLPDEGFRVIGYYDGLDSNNVIAIELDKKVTDVTN